MKKRFLPAIVLALAVALSCTFTSQAFAASETNSTKAAAKTLSSGTLHTGKFDQHLDERWFKFTAPSNGYITYTFTNPAVNDSSILWSSTLYDANGVELYACSHSGNGSNSARATIVKDTSGNPSYTSPNIGVAANKTYYAKSVFQGSGTSAYRAKLTFTSATGWEVESNNEAASANTLAVNTDIKGTVASTKSDYFKINTPSRGPVTVSLSHKKIADANAKWNADIYVVDPDTGLRGKMTSITSKGTETTATTQLMGLPKSTLYVEVWTYSNNSVEPYTLRVNHTTASNWEMESNDSKKTSNEAAINTWIYGNIGWGADGIFVNSDCDWYKFTVPADGKATLQFNHPATGSSENSWYVYLGDAWTNSSCAPGFDGGNTWKWNTGVAKMNVAGTTAKTDSTKTVNVSAGTYWVKVEKGYKFSAAKYGLRLNFTRDPIKATPAVTVKSAATYTGKLLKPSVTVKVNGKKLTTANYTVKYSNNTKVGKASVKVTLKNGYSGTKTVYFKINPKATTLKKVTAAKKGFKATWKKQATQTTGYQIRYSTAKSMSGAKTVTVSKTKTTSKAVSKLKGGKKYYVQVRTYKKIGSTKYYSAWSAKKTVTTKK